jgi:hypothetical protein
MKNGKNNLASLLCVFWAMAVALFWFAMRVIWSGISKVLYEAMGKTEPTDFLLNLPLYVSVFLWVLFAFAVINFVQKGNKKKSTIALSTQPYVLPVPLPPIIAIYGQFSDFA